MKILLDENMPHKLLFALRDEGHDSESIHSLKLTGIKNGELYQRLAPISLPLLPQRGGQGGVSHSPLPLLASPFRNQGEELAQRTINA